MLVFTRGKAEPRSGTNVPHHGMFRHLTALCAAATFVVMPGCIDPHRLAVEGQGVVIGRVIDAKYQRPIAAAVVSVTPNRSGSSDTDGSFALTLPAGPYTLTASSPGYSDLTIPIRITSGKTGFATKDGYLRLQALGGVQGP